MRRPNLIGICGRARSGKDTLAAFLVAQYGGYHYAFANPMRRMLHSGLGVDLGSDYWQGHKEDTIPAIGKSPRQLMQTLGTEWGRQTINPDLWVILAKQELINRGPGMIITDVRFENEASWIRNVGGLVIHLERKDAAPVHAHSSESGVMEQPQDYRIHNNAGLEELQFSVMKLFD